jgi:NADPH-dependent curcumin reductase CurA
MAAWIGLDVVDARAGETVVVTSAAGGVGYVACQIARIAGLDVIALARGIDKVRWLAESLPSVRVLDEDDDTCVAAITPYDILFENVAGPRIAARLGRIRKFGRVALCGVIAEYETGQPTDLALAPLVFKDITVRGYFADDYLSRWGGALDTLGRWLHEGRLTRGYDIEHGLERLPDVYLRLFRGHTNRGKLMLRVADL